ncbi:MAG: carbohydrate binding domain-containing protein, partial [Pirellulales bacterium]|nr:carbohydrate binding domain-containing protein [Pirellulales bacterium]
GLTDWIVQATETAQVEVVNVDDPRVLLTPTDTGTAEIIQQVSVTPRTAYRLSFTINSTSDSYAYAGVRGHAGKWSELSTGENKAGRYTLEFETSSDVSEVTIFAQAYRQQTTPVSIDDIQLALADSPPVSPEPEPPTETPIEPPQDQPIEPPTETPPPSVGDSLLENGDFESDLSGWSDISTAGGKAETIPGAAGSVLQLSPSAEGTAALLQQVAVDPSTSYRLSFSLTSVGGSYGYAGVRGHAGKWSEISVGDNASGLQTLDFVTDADVSEITVFLQAYRQQTAPIVIDDIRLEANNGTPTPEPINPPPVDTTPPDETPTDPAPPEELPPRVGDNLVRNADFSTGDLSGWQSSGPAGAATLSDGVLKLAATQDNTIRVEQMITGLQPETRYSFSVKLRSLEGAWASFGVDAGTQYAKTNSAKGDAWQEKRFTFYTAADSTQVRLFLESYMGQPGPVFFDDVKIVEGKLTPVTPPDEGWFTLPAPRALVNAGEEMLLNSDFEDGLTGWVRDHAEITNNTVTLTPTSDESARLVQDIPFALP